MTAEMRFHPPLLLDSNGAGRKFPLALRIYTSASDKRELYRLRYRAFREAGWIEENPHGEFIDRFDPLASTFAVAAFHKGACAGAIRLALSDAGTAPLSMPCMEQFPREVGALMTPERGRLVEYTRMAIEPSLTNNSFRTTLYGSLVRAAYILSYAADVDLALIAVHRKTSAFYQKMLGFEVVASSESYASIAEPTHLLARAFHELENRRAKRSAFFAVSADEIEAARRTFAAARRQAAA